MGRATQITFVVLDNTVLSNFAVVGRPDLVCDLWPEAVFTTPEVLIEYQAGVLMATLPPDVWNSLPVLYLDPSETAFALSLPHRLGKGERSCLAVVVSRNGLLATDDYDVRQFAQRAGVPVIGSVGILIRSVQMEMLSLPVAQRLLDRMVAYGYRSPIDRLEDLI